MTIGTASIAGLQPSKMNAIVFASCFGTIIEWYDFLIYATAAALVFNKAFFPTFDPLAGTRAGLCGYSPRLSARPLCRRPFGHFGGRLGPQALLEVAFFFMGPCTFCVGLLL